SLVLFAWADPGVTNPAWISFVAPLPLFVWWLRCRFRRLTITTRRLRLRRGLVFRSEIDVRIVDVRDVRVDKSPLQFLFGAGSLTILGADEYGEFTIRMRGVSSPAKWKEAILEHGRR